MRKPRLTDRGIFLIGVLIIASIASSLVVYSYGNPELILRFTDKDGNPATNSLVAIYADLPNGETKVIAQGKTDGYGIFRFRMDMMSFTKKWINHEKNLGSGYRYIINTVGLVYHIINPNEKYVWTGIIEIPVHKPPVFSKQYNIKIGKNPLKTCNCSSSKTITTGLKPKDFCYRWRHYTEIRDSYETHGRFIVARFNTSSHSKAIVLASIKKGDIWRAKMWFGFSFSDYLQLATGAKWSGSPTAKIDRDAGVGYSGVAVLSIKLTFHYEKIYHKIWDPQCGLISQYYEYRIWHKDVDFNSLSAVNVNASYYFGDAYEDFYTTFVGHGVNVEDPHLYFTISDVDVENTMVLNIGVSSDIKNRLRGSMPDKFLPQVGITVDRSQYLESFVGFQVWADDGYIIDVYLKYLRVNGIPFAVGYAVDSGGLPPGITPDCLC